MIAGLRLVRILPTIALAAIAVQFGLMWLQTQRQAVTIAGLEARSAQLIADRDSAVGEISNAIARAQRIAASERDAADRLRDRLAAVEVAQDACLEQPLPKDLLP